MKYVCIAVFALMSFTAQGQFRKDIRLDGASIAAVKNDMLTQARVTNVSAALSSKISGLQINQTNNGVNGAVRVVSRGNRYFSGNNQALVVLDGRQISSDIINSINPNDVNEITFDDNEIANLIPVKRLTDLTIDIEAADAMSWEITVSLRKPNGKSIKEVKLTGQGTNNDYQGEFQKIMTEFKELCVMNHYKKFKRGDEFGSYTSEEAKDEVNLVVFK